MKQEVRMPKMGESIVQGTIGRIFKKSGEAVSNDEELCEIETEKVNQSIVAPVSGAIEWKVKEGDTVKIDQVLAVIDVGQEVKKEPTPLKKVQNEPPVVRGRDDDRKSDVRQKMEDYFNQSVEPVLKDLPKQEPVTHLGTTERRKMTRLRKTIAERLVQAKNETAMLTTFNEVDMSKVMELRVSEQEAFLKKHGVKLGFMSFFIKACVAALEEYPEMNAKMEGDEIVYHHFYDIGVAVGTDKGLFVPVIRMADKLSYAEIEKQLKEYAEKAKAGTITIDEMQGGTFTITNGGVYGSMLSTPILNPPQSGILGMHNIVKRAVVVNDEIVIRPIMYLALSYDHRIVDGKQSIGFLMHIKKTLEEPTRLLLDL